MATITVIGLGYVGLPLAIAFSRFNKVIGYDTSITRIAELKRGFDRNGDCDLSTLGVQSKITFECDETRAFGSDIFIITVPTPVDDYNVPDLSHLRAATQAVCRNLREGVLIVYESTVYPGATLQVVREEIESKTSFRLNQSFGVGYTPERINPGDKVHTLSTTAKIISASNPKYLDDLEKLYLPICPHLIKANSIEHAEAAKIIENTQRDVNIALVNEFSLLFRRMGIDIYHVLELAKSKWNFLDFTPGLVGGHCIGVDPYYLTYKAASLGYHPELITAGRKINDSMAEVVVLDVMDDFRRYQLSFSEARLLVLGLTFKENCADTRNSQAVKVVERLEKIISKIEVYDPIASDIDFDLKSANIISSRPDLFNYDYVLILVAHSEFIEMFNRFDGDPRKPYPYIYDVKNCISNLVKSQNIRTL